MKLLRRVPVPLLLAILILIPFWDLIWLPADQSIAANDLDFLFYRWWRFALDSLRQGELPLWNPFLFSGAPFLANPQPALFYPPVWLLAVFSVTQTAALLFLLHLWIAGLGMYGWLRSENADRMGALFGAVIFAFGGFFSVRLFGGHLGVVMTLAWLPGIFWAFHTALKRNSLALAIVAGLLIALSVLAGHTASFLYVGLALAAYVLFHAVVNWQRSHDWLTALKPLLFVTLLVLTGLGLAAVQLLPTWEFLRLSTRQQVSYAFAVGNSWPPGYLVTLLIPNFFGELARTGYWGDGIYTEMIFYVGVLPLLLVLALGFGKATRHKLVLFLIVLGGAALLLAMGQFTVLHRLVYNFLPPFQAARAPARAGILFAFSIAALAGVLLAGLRQKPEQATPGLRRFTQGPLPWIVGSLVALVILAGYLVFAIQRDSNSDAGRLWHVANNSALFLIFFLLSIGLMWAWAMGRVNARQGTLLAIIIVLLDLWSFARVLINPVPLEESGYWRIVSEITAGAEGRVLPWGLSIFEHNKGLPFGLFNVFGYDPLELDRYARFTTAVPDPRATAYDLLHTRYLVTTGEMAFPDEPGAPRLLEQREGVWVYERPLALPPAWLVHRAEIHDEASILARLNDPAFDPATTALLERAADCELNEAVQPEEVDLYRRGNNRVEVDVRAASGGILVLSQVFYPGWHATLDSKPVPLVQADYVLQAVCVPAGEHRVTLTFEPASLRTGAGITFLFLLLVGFAGLSKIPGLFDRADN